MPDKWVYVTRRIPKPGLTKLSELFNIDSYESDEAIPHDVLVNSMKEKRYDALLCMLTDKIDKEVLDAAGPQLKIVATMSVGYEHIDLQECAKRNILVANTPGVSTDSVAELTVSLLLMTARRVPEGVNAVKKGEWGQWKPMWLCGTELTGKVLGIYGLGRIGFNVGRRLKPFGFSKIYYTDVQEVSYAKDIDAEFINFEGLIQKCDFICVCCNLTPQTRHMFNADVFKKMKRNAILINTGRGGVIDHEALTEALKNGDITAAGLDVTEPEPLPKTHPLVSLPNCVILPHMGSNTWDSRNAMAEIAARNCVAAITNSTPEGIVSV
ncbi:glyoxylate reductase/hydroxypyruvate reductase [Biomphalaria glabrata]|uniref:Glyoxylate reductase/hydroxypyruvate reductase n=1 Tax=Biomphalaria glabrata TaxID=6526 RepID=A0A2C9K4K4_BIOGL|nr:glyoxylate reductase/hydroxypyruvate reductase-like [Biomphalaria glabrata]KAI8737603.1 glyoxylate reductase/hydroxypyruvate reductase-like [Biomphalaria glabrata]KAI8795353.1 glyoxylate reductase/hydroxypyruvate reductase [Biomphalaria glabrata]